jgi:hypothetical protein
MTLRLALLVVLFAACDDSDDREAHPIVLPPAAPSEPRTSDGEDVSPLTPIVLPKEATPPPMQAAPPPPPVQPTEVIAPPAPEPVEPKKAEVIEAPVAAAPAIAKAISPAPKKAPVKKKTTKKR